MGARDGPTVSVVAEMLTIEVLLEIAASRERLQAVDCRKFFVSEAKDTLGSATFKQERFC